MTRWAALLAMTFTPVLAMAQPAPDEPPAPPTEPAPPPEPPAETETPEQPAVAPEPQTSEPTTDDFIKGDDPDHTKKKTKITHKPGKYVELRATDGTRYRLRLTVQPMMRFTRISTQGDPVVDWIIRRARLGFVAKLHDHVGLKWEVQIKNMHLGLSNLYGIYEPSKNTKIEVGFIKAPGGLERDSYSFNEPFIERSVVAFFTYDHEVGVKLDGRTDDNVFYAASIMRTAPFAVDGGDPEDTPIYPPGVEPDDITRSSSKWNAAARIGIAPSHDYEASVSGGTRLRLDREEPDFGDRVAEPYDSGFVDPRPYYGANFHVAADAAVRKSHFRAMIEGGYRRDGEQLAFDYTTGASTSLHGHLNAEMGYLVLGWTPDGKYAKAEDSAYLKRGWEIVTRVEAARVKPVDLADPILFVGVTTGFHWEVSPELRLQADFGWQKFSDNAEGSNARGPNREIFQLWGTWRI